MKIRRRKDGGRGRRQDNTVNGNVRRLLVGLAIALFATTVRGQQIGNPTTQQGVTFPRGNYVIRNAHIVTMSGAEIENGTVVISDGKIAAVGATVNAPSDAQQIDGHGLSIYPGMMDAGTSMGLLEVGQGAN